MGCTEKWRRRGQHVSFMVEKIIVKQYFEEKVLINKRIIKKNVKLPVNIFVRSGACRQSCQGQAVATAGDDKPEKTAFGGCPGERGRAADEGKTDEAEEDLKAQGL